MVFDYLGCFRAFFSVGLCLGDAFVYGAKTAVFLHGFLGVRNQRAEIRLSRKKVAENRWFSPEKCGPYGNAKTCSKNFWKKKS